MDKVESSQGVQINYTFKILYALGIIFVVTAHAGFRGFSIFTDFFPFYAFHLALFMFASGYFFNRQNENDVKTFIIKKFKKLIIPLYLWNFLYAFILFFLVKLGFYITCKINFLTIFLSPLISGTQFILNNGGWFIIPLFLIHIFNILLKKFFSRFRLKEFFILMLSVILYLIGTKVHFHLYNSSLLMIDRVLYFLPFYSLGILYYKYEKHDKLNSLLYFSIIIISILFLLYKYGTIPSAAPSDAVYYKMSLVTGMLAIAFWLRVSKILTLSIGKNHYINLIANNTYAIMINHPLGFFLLNAIFAVLNKYTTYCSGFDINAYHTKLWYFYLPHNINQFLIIYVVAGIIFSIYLQKIITKCFGKFFSVLKLFYIQLTKLYPKS